MKFLILNVVFFAILSSGLKAEINFPLLEYISGGGHFIELKSLEVLSKNPNKELRKIIQNENLSDFIRVRAAAGLSLFKKKSDHDFIFSQIQSSKNNLRLVRYLMNTIIIRFPVKFLDKKQIHFLENNKFLKNEFKILKVQKEKFDLKSQTIKE